MAAEKPSLWLSFKPKARCIGSFAKHCKDHEKERADLLKFIDSMVTDFKSAEEEKATEEDQLYQFRVRKFSVKKTTKSRYTDKDIEYTFSKEGHDEFCFICRKPFPQFSKDIFPCRVCTRAFHKNCVLVLKDSECSQFDKTCLDRVQNNTGWSCHFCVDMATLLTEKEMKYLVERFDEIDSNHDCFINLEEYKMYKTATIHEGNSKTGQQQIALQFQKMDTDHDGLVKWWQFLNQEAKLMLAKRSSDELLDLLTEKEIVHAKAFFSRMDDDNDGFISHTDALIAYKTWYRRFDEPTDGRDTSSLNLHANVAAKIIMDHDSTNTGLVTWEEFVAGQALYIICGRPNI